MNFNSRRSRIVAGVAAYVALAGLAIEILPNLIYPPEKAPFSPVLAERAAASALMSYQIKGNKADCSVDGRAGFSSTAFSANNSVSACVARPRYDSPGFNNLMSNVGFDTVANILISYHARFTSTSDNKKSVTVNGYVADMGGKSFGIFIANDIGKIYYIPKKDTDCWKSPLAATKR